MTQPLHKQKGFSILELLIALAIGIILLLALANVYFTANNVSKQQSLTSQLDEITRQVYRRLEYDLSRAGYVDLMDTPAVLNDPMTGIGPTNVTQGQTYGQALLNYQRINKIYAKAANEVGSLTPLPAAQYSAIGFISNGQMQPVIGCGNAFPVDFGACNAAADSNRQGLRIAYQAENISGSNLRSLRTAAEQVGDGTGVALANGALDCTGSAIPNEANGFVINQYSINNGEFRCDGNGGGNTQPIVNGVEELTFRFLLTEQANVGAIASTTNSGLYVSDRLTPQEMVTPATAPTLSWAGVVGVEVCLIVASEPIDGSNINELRAVQNNQRPTCARNNNNTFAADIAIAAGDNRLYRRSLKTFSLPNLLNITSR